MADIIKSVDNIPQRFKDLLDGTYARIVTLQAATAQDIIKSEDNVNIRYRNMGDGTYAEVVANG